MISLAALLAIVTTQSIIAQVGRPYIHDPSTIVECDEKYYTFGTGGGGLISNDGWTWYGGGVRPGGAGNHKGAILTMWNKTLDPKSPDFKYSEPILVAASDGYEENDVIRSGNWSVMVNLWNLFWIHSSYRIRSENWKA